MSGTAAAQKSHVFVGSTKFPVRADTKVIMITGGAGFIASFVVRHFVVTYPEYTVISYDKLDYCSSLNNTASMEGLPNFKFARGDITDPERTLQVRLSIW